MAPAGNMIIKTYDGFEVKARQRLNSETEFENFINAFMEKLDSAAGSEVVVSDLDLSQNKLSIDQWCQVITALSAANARVLRFRLFGSASLNDDIIIQIADYFAGLNAKQAPQEIHLSDCAITTSGFNYFVEKLESVDYYPLKVGAGRPTPLYVRLENNYIDESAIKEKIDAGVIKPFTKRDGRPSGEQGAKISLLVLSHGRFQQRSGTPPSPENAPPPKQINDLNSRGGGRAYGDYQDRRDSSQQWPATRGGTTTRWSSADANQGSRHGAAPTNKYGDKSIFSPSTRTTSMPLGRSHGDRSGDRGYNDRRDDRSYNDRSHGDRRYGDRSYDDRSYGAKVDRSRTPNGRGGDGMSNRGSAGKGCAKGGDKGRKQRLPHPWQEQWSDEFKIPYFWNSETGDSVWERPVA